MSSTATPDAATQDSPEAQPASCCPPDPAAILCAPDAAALAAKFKALADPNRLKILSIVGASAGDEACVCDIQQPLELGQPTVSHHLKILVDAGFLTREKRGVWAYYSLVPGALDGLAATLRGGI